MLVWSAWPVSDIIIIIYFIKNLYNYIIIYTVAKVYIVSIIMYLLMHSHALLIILLIGKTCRVLPYDLTGSALFDIIIQN